MSNIEGDSESPGRMRRYLMVARNGIESQNLTLQALNKTKQSLTIDQLSSVLESEINASETPPAAALMTSAVKSIAGSAKERSGSLPSFTVMHSYGSDGPKMVRARPTAERLLRASGYRLLPITKYRTMEYATPAHRDGGIDGGYQDFLQTTLITELDRQGGPRGAGIKIGIIDSGIDASHPSLAHAFDGGRATVNNEDELDFSACPQEGGDHGTHVAGIIAAARNGRNPVGLAPEAKIRSYRVFPRRGKLLAENAAIIDAIRMAVDDECHIINLSIGSRAARDDGLRDAMKYAWDAGVLCIAAAGNDRRRSVSFPAAYPYCVGVSAIGRDGCFPAGEGVAPKSPRSAHDPSIFLADFSNVGPQIDATAPGVHVMSTLPGGGFGAKSGTSMSTPVVSGFAAVVFSRHLHEIGNERSCNRSELLFKLLAAQCRSLKLGSYDYEGYGLPTP